MRRKFIAGNWKMYKTMPEAIELVSELKRLLAMVRNVDVAVVPPALFVEPVAKRLAESNIGVGVQNIHDGGFGAFTGEISASMLPGLGIKYAVVAHSERRQYFGETDEGANRKVRALLDNGIIPILCIGETLAQREAGETFSVLAKQMAGGLKDLTAGQVAGMVLAYEPVWAIGTGVTAQPEQVAEVHSWLRNWLADRFDAGSAEQVIIQYGGSVKPSNAGELMRVPNVDGALVGGASLDAASFVAIVKSCV